MSSLPAAPLFVCHPKSSYFRFQFEAETTTRANSLGAQNAFGTIVFDAEGVLWSFVYEGTKELGLFGKILAQVYNPSVLRTVQWTRLREYDFAELQGAYREAIRKDDDILTQFVDADKLIGWIDECKDFNGLVKVWKRANPDRSRRGKSGS